MTPIPIRERLVSKRELAQRLGITPRCLDKWIAKGLIPPASIRLSRKAVNWTETEVLALIESLKQRKAG